MHKLKTLLTLELRALYGYNKFRYSKDKKERKRYLLLALSGLLVLGMLLFYLGATVYALCQFGLQDILPAFLILLVSLLLFLFRLFTSVGRIFSQKGYDILASLPVPNSFIPLSRFLSLYIEDLVLSFLFFLPAEIIYGILVQPPPLFYLLLLVILFFLPAIPLTLSLFFGMGIFAISSRTKAKSLIQTLGMIGIVLGIVFSSFLLQSKLLSFSTAQWHDTLQNTLLQLTNHYPPARWVGQALTQTSLTGVLLYLLTSVLFLFGCLAFVTHCFSPLFHRLWKVSTGKTIAYKEGKSRPVLFALLWKEGKRYFSSSTYVVNTILGPVFATIASIALCILGKERILGALPFDITPCLPLFCAAIFCMMPPSSVSISMEGKEIWILQSLPISTKSFLGGKVLWNLLLVSPFYVITQGCLWFALRPALSQAILSMLLFALLTVCSILFGIAVNLKFHSFDWQRDEQVVKQSASALIGGFAGMLLSFVCALLFFLTPVANQTILSVILCLLLAFLGFLLDRHNNRTPLVSL